MALAGEHPLDGGGHRSVVDRVAQLVAGAGRRQVSLQVDVDLERLGPLGLLGQGAMGAEAAQAPKLDPVAQEEAPVARERATATSSRPGVPIWRWVSCSRMEMAEAGAATSPANTR